MPRDKLVAMRIALVVEVDQIEHFVANFAALRAR